MTFSTPDLCDAFPDDVRVVALQFRSFGGRPVFAGPVVPVRCHEDNSVVKELVGSPGEGRVLVVDGGGSLRRALLGDMLAQQAADNGWAGIVIHGAVRDVEILATIDLGVLALGATPLRSAKRGEGEQGVPVSVGGVTVAPGDHVYADGTGVVVSARPLSG